MARRRRRRRSSRRWIQKAHIKRGALRKQLKRGLARKIAAATRSPVYTRSEEINTNTLRKFKKTKAYQKLDTRTKRRINLAITFEKMHKGK